MALSHTTAILRIPEVLGVFSVLDVGDCVLGTEEGGSNRCKKTKKQRIEFVEMAASATLSRATGTFVQEEPGGVEILAGVKQKMMSLS